MESTQQIADKLKQILTESQVLTDLEDLYVYSFEKVFKDQNYPKPDIVVRVYSPEEENEVIELVAREKAILIKRGEKFPLNINKSFQTLILLDNIKIPKLEICNDKLIEKNRTIANLKKFHTNAYGTYKNLEIAVQNLLIAGPLNKCQECVTCSGYCTVAPSFKGVETWSSKGRMLIGRGIMKGEIPLSEKIVDVLYSCTKCGLCFAQCFQDLELHEALLHIRHELAEKNLVPEVFQIAKNNIFEHGDPSAIPVNRRLSRIKNIPIKILTETADNLCWLGCTVSTRIPKTAEAFINILNRINVDFTMLGEKEGCCGYVLIATGLWDEAKKVAIEVIERIERTKAKTLITPCSGCYYTFTRLYPEVLNVELPCEILHSSQYLEKLIKEEKIKLKPLNLNVTYHDPCSLGRHSKVYDAPRNVLKAIPNLNLIEMPLNRNRARCCGGGGGLWTFNNQVSLETTQMRLKEDFLPMNVNILTTACPQCQLNFRFASRSSSIPKNQIKIYDITELFDLAMQSE